MTEDDLATICLEAMKKWSGKEDPYQMCTSDRLAEVCKVYVKGGKKPSVTWNEFQSILDAYTTRWVAAFRHERTIIINEAQAAAAADAGASYFVLHLSHVISFVFSPSIIVSSKKTEQKKKLSDGKSPAGRFAKKFTKK